MLNGSRELKQLGKYLLLASLYYLLLIEITKIIKYLIFKFNTDFSKLINI